MVRNILFAPRTWLAMGAFCIGSSFVIGYHEEHRSAQEVLHAKVGLPEEVLIQNFAPDLHMNLIRQVRVLGETVEGHSQTINLGSVEAPRWIEAVPVYPVGSDFAPIIAQRLSAATGQPRRPMPRAKAAEAARLHESMNSFRNHAFAFAISDNSGETSQSTNGLDVLADFDDRKLVRLSGALVTGPDFMQTVASAMGKTGIASTPETLMIEPAPQFADAGASQNYFAQLRTWLTVFGVLSALVAMLTPFFRNAAALENRRSAATQDVKAAHAFPAVQFFQPIATQDELSQEEARQSALGDQSASGPLAAILNALSTLASNIRLKSLQ